MTSADLDRLDELASKATEGPWEWYGNTKARECHLATVHGGRVFVMGFARWGMGSAQPMFQVRDKGIMEPVARFARYEAAYRSDFTGIDHPDAAYIAAADPSTVRALIAEVRRLRRGVEVIKSRVYLTGSLEPEDIADNLLAGREWNNGESK